MQKVAVIGVDSVPPSILFNKLLPKLPNIRKMYEGGLHGELQSCHPPITVPSWMVMMTGKSPGHLGVYGFRHRKGFSYTDGYIVNSTHIRERTVWEILSQHGMRSVVLGVPPTYPPKQIPDCSLVSCFITPNKDRPFTSPPSLKEEVLKAAGGDYIFDVTFRTEDRDAVKDELFDMTRRRFDVAEYLAKTKQWDFFMMHEIGFDRLHHAFWKFFDPKHPRYVPGNKYEHIDEEYYTYVDGRLGTLLDIFGEDCKTFVLSDHGSKAMKGAFCVNQWLEREGYLKFKRRPETVTDLDDAEVDWTETKAWGWGGYYARIFFNVKGREATGIIEPSELASVRADLKKRLQNVRDSQGGPMSNQVYTVEELYGEDSVGDKPDLMVYFDDLNWRSAGTVGHKSLYLDENDTGPDDSVHSMDGIFMMYDPKGKSPQGLVSGARVEDIGPTLLHMYGLGGEAMKMDGHLLKEVSP